MQIKSSHLFVTKLNRDRTLSGCSDTTLFSLPRISLSSTHICQWLNVLRRNIWTKKWLRTCVGFSWEDFSMTICWKAGWFQLSSLCRRSQGSLELWSINILTVWAHWFLWLLKKLTSKLAWSTSKGEGRFSPMFTKIFEFLMIMFAILIFEKFSSSALINRTYFYKSFALRALSWSEVWTFQLRKNNLKPVCWNTHKIIFFYEWHGYNKIPDQKHSSWD